MGERDLDLVLFGATGFVGRLTAAHLARHAPAGLRVGLAGRSVERLAAVAAEIGDPAGTWPRIAVDATDPAAVEALAERARVVVSTVGPYARYGLSLVGACAQAGTHYADLTGEVLFVRESIDRYDALARGSGARIVHSAGFDSLPSDLGVLSLVAAARADGAGDPGPTTLLVTGLRGGVSGGTLASLAAQLDAVRADPGARRLALDPHALCPDPAAHRDPADRDLLRPVREDGEWLAPFVMAVYNTRVVRRSAALAGYGPAFRYREALDCGTGPAGAAKAVAVSAGLAAGVAVMASPARRWLTGRVLPAPGEGPGERTRERGYFRIHATMTTTSGVRYTAEIGARGDPGYAATAVMLGESALALALDTEALPEHAGVLTPATGLGMTVVDRLRAAGFTWQVARG